MGRWLRCADDMIHRYPCWPSLTWRQRVPDDHPLRLIKAVTDKALVALSSDLDRMYAEVGRPSIPPERLLKSSLLISLYSVRSERAFCEQLDLQPPLPLVSGYEPS